MLDLVIYKNKAINRFFGNLNRQKFNTKKTIITILVL